MKIERVTVLGMAAVLVAGALAVAGCGRNSESEPASTAGVGERTGAALDRAAEKTVEVATNVAGKTADAAKATAEVAKDVAGKVVETKRNGARPVTLEEVNGRPLPARLRDGIARLLTPYL